MLYLHTSIIVTAITQLTINQFIINFLSIRALSFFYIFFIFVAVIANHVISPLHVLVLCLVKKEYHHQSQSLALEGLLSLLRSTLLVKTTLLLLIVESALLRRCLLLESTLRLSKPVCVSWWLVLLP